MSPPETISLGRYPENPRFHENQQIAYFGWSDFFSEKIFLVLIFTKKKFFQIFFRPPEIFEKSNFRWFWKSGKAPVWDGIPANLRFTPLSQNLKIRFSKILAPRIFFPKNLFLVLIFTKKKFFRFFFRPPKIFEKPIFTIFYGVWGIFGEMVWKCPIFEVKMPYLATQIADLTFFGHFSN
jgi:hypothetical protein